MTPNLTIILVKPRDPNNIGAAARAMANFGLEELRVVSPFEPTWRSAVSAVGAQDILLKARLYDSLPQALGECTFSLAATALKNRKLGQPVISLPDLPALLEEKTPEKTALVFGNEKTGLSNEDIALCSAVLHIPTTAKQPSVNLAQAVILACYEMARTRPANPKPAPAAPTRATFAQTEMVVEELEALMQRAELKTDYSPEQRKSLLRGLLHKTDLSKNDLFFIKTFASHLNASCGRPSNEKPQS